MLAVSCRDLALRDEGVSSRACFDIVSSVRLLLARIGVIFGIVLQCFRRGFEGMTEPLPSSLEFYFRRCFCGALACSGLILLP